MTMRDGRSGDAGSGTADWSHTWFTERCATCGAHQSSLRADGPCTGPFDSAGYVHNCLLTIEASIQGIEEQCSDYGGWAGEDEDAKRAVDLCQRLMGYAWVVAIHGREAAERE